MQHTGCIVARRKIAGNTGRLHMYISAYAGRYVQQAVIKTDMALLTACLGH